MATGTTEPTTTPTRPQSIMEGTYRKAHIPTKKLHHLGQDQYNGKKKSHLEYRQEWIVRGKYINYVYESIYWS
jgi:hypothetical protein